MKTFWGLSTVALVLAVAPADLSAQELPGKGTVEWNYKAMERGYKIIRIDYDADKRCVVFLLEAKEIASPGFWVQMADADGVSILDFGIPQSIQCNPPGPQNKGERTRAYLFLPNNFDKARKVVVRHVLDDL